MIIVDKALAKREQEGRPIRVGMVGAGFMARGVALQIFTCTPGMELVAVANRTLDTAKRAYTESGVTESDVRVVESVRELEDAIERKQYAVTDDALLLCQAAGIDVILEITGAIEFSARVALAAMENGKHLVTMNAELDGTVGPILKTYADKAGLMYTVTDGDQPGVEMNLYRFVRDIGVRPVLCGNIKGLHDPYRNPTTQEGFARQWKQNAQMVTSFADGSKISFEQALVANATGMRVAQRGMFGPTVPSGTPIEKSVDLFPLDALMNGPGIVDYVVGAVPNGGVFVLGTHDDPVQQHYLKLYKVGPGPLYCFFNPYHLCHFEVPTTVARAVLFQDAAVAPIAGPVVEVVATAKIDLKAGGTIDGIGGYQTYGQCENADTTRAENLLPIGVAENCRLVRDVAKDTVLTYADVELPSGRLVDRLRSEQTARFAAL